MVYENVARMCMESGISISKLEKETSIGNGTIKKWETSSPNLNTAKKVADYFGCTVDDLLKGK